MDSEEKTADSTNAPAEKPGNPLLNELDSIKNDIVNEVDDIKEDAAGTEETGE